MVWPVVLLGTFVVVVIVWYAVFFLWPCLPIWRAGGRVRRGNVIPTKFDDNPVREAVRKVVYRFRVASISFADRPITDADLARLGPALGRFPCLWHLDIDRTRVTGAGFIHFTGLPALKVMQVEHLRFTRKQMDELDQRLYPSYKPDWEQLRFCFHARPRRNPLWMVGKGAALQDGRLYVPTCDRCECFLRDYVDRGKGVTFGAAADQFEGVVCEACPAQKGGPHVLCDDCHPPDAGRQCPQCARPLKPVFEAELKAMYIRYSKSCGFRTV